MSNMIERVARVLAECSGDKWDDIPNDKSDWVKRRGQFGSRFRDVNERFRCDYLDEARAAIEAMREPTEGMLATTIPFPEHLARSEDPDYRKRMEAATLADRMGVRSNWQLMIDAALTSAGRGVENPI